MKSNFNFALVKARIGVQTVLNKKGWYWILRPCNLCNKKMSLTINLRKDVRRYKIMCVPAVGDNGTYTGRDNVPLTQ